eukprot:tig00000025_g7941.t1
MASIPSSYSYDSSQIAWQRHAAHSQYAAAGPSTSSFFPAPTSMPPLPQNYVPPSQPRARAPRSAPAPKEEPDSPEAEGPSTSNGKTRPPRPQNAFILFSNDRRPELHKQYAHLANAEVSKILGYEWKNLPPAAKDKYVARAHAIKQKFQQEYPDYQYTRGPSRKKRKNAGGDAAPAPVLAPQPAPAPAPAAPQPQYPSQPPYGGVGGGTHPPAPAPSSQYSASPAAPAPAIGTPGASPAPLDALSQGAGAGGASGAGAAAPPGMSGMPGMPFGMMPPAMPWMMFSPWMMPSMPMMPPMMPMMPMTPAPGSSPAPSFGSSPAPSFGAPPGGYAPLPGVLPALPPPTTDHRGHS